MSEDKYSHGKIPRVHHEMGDHQDPHSMVKRIMGDQDTVQYYLSMAYYSKDEQKLKECLDRVLIETTKVAMGVQSLLRTLTSGATPDVASGASASERSASPSSGGAVSTKLSSADTAEIAAPDTMASATPAVEESTSPLVNGEVENTNVEPFHEE